MLSLFPQILFLAPAGTTLLRIAAALIFVYMARYFWNHRAEIIGVPVPIVGNFHVWMLIVSIVATSAVAVLLFIGLFVQAAAIAGAIIAAKQLFFFTKYQHIFPYGRATYFLLIAVCLSLLVSGAGAFAFDMPL